MVLCTLAYCTVGMLLSQPLQERILLACSIAATELSVHSVQSCKKMFKPISDWYMLNMLTIPNPHSLNIRVRVLPKIFIN